MLNLKDSERLGRPRLPFALALDREKHVQTKKSQIRLLFKEQSHLGLLVCFLNS